MSDDPRRVRSIELGPARQVLTGLFMGMLRDILRLVIAFAIGTGAAAIACWYYGLPLVLSLGGGFIVLGVAAVIVSASLFS